jgi:hypothetical protein
MVVLAAQAVAVKLMVLAALVLMVKVLRVALVRGLMVCRVVAAAVLVLLVQTAQQTRRVMAVLVWRVPSLAHRCITRVVVVGAAPIILELVVMAGVETALIMA